MHNGFSRFSCLLSGAKTQLFTPLRGKPDKITLNYLKFRNFFRTCSQSCFVDRESNICTNHACIDC